MMLLRPFPSLVEQLKLCWWSGDRLSLMIPLWSQNSAQKRKWKLVWPLWEYVKDWLTQRAQLRIDILFCRNGFVMIIKQRLLAEFCKSNSQFRIFFLYEYFQNWSTLMNLRDETTVWYTKRSDGESLISCKFYDILGKLSSLKSWLNSFVKTTYKNTLQFYSIL